MQKIDFSILNDEQLLDLMRGIMGEFMKRNLVTEARDIMLTEKERFEIENEALLRVQKRQKEEERKRIIQEAEAKAEKQAKAKQAKEAIEKNEKIWATMVNLLEKEHQK